MTKVGLVVLSFSLRDDEPNPCNLRLAKEALRISHQLIGGGYETVVVAQWEVGAAFRRIHTPFSWVSVAQPEDGSYLGTEDVLDAAIKTFYQQGCEALVIVANPFIHQQYAYWLVRKAGMRLMWRRVRWIGFDKYSNQWWCRSWWQLIYQSARLVLGFKHGYGGRQDAVS